MDDEVFMSKIVNYNCDGLCVHEFCGSKYTHSTRQTINGMKIVLGFCKEHAKEFEDYIWNKKKEIKK